MTQISYKSVWQASIDELMLIKKNQWGMVAGYPGVMKWVEEKGGRFSTWHLLALPASAVEDDLDSSINISCVYTLHPYAQTFLAWANEAADRALSDIRFTYDPDEERLKGNPDPLSKRGWRAEGVYPGNHGATLAAACLARALRDNSELDGPALLQACDEIAESALYGGAKFWDYIAQSLYLRCVRLSLVAGDVNKAQHFLQSTRRKFKHTFVHQEWLQSLVNAITQAASAPLGLKATGHFQSFFDQVRNPDYQLPSNQPGGINLHANISILRLELAIIQQRYVLTQPLVGQWQQVLGLISA